MANKRYGTYGYTPEGNRVDLYVENGQTFLPDGTRLPSGYSVQTKGGIYKMGDNGGYSVNEHNVPQYNPVDVNQYLQNFKFQSDKDYSQLGKDMYKPIYDAKANAIRNRLNLDTQSLNAQTGQVNTTYDNQVQAQHDMNKVSKDNYSNETLNRGLGRSTIASTGLASMDMANQKQVNSINDNRNMMLNNIQSRIQALTENANSELSTLDSNRALEEQKYAMDYEDRDRGHWLQEAQLNAPMYQQALKRQFDIEDRNYDNTMEQYKYDMGLERDSRQYREGTPEYELAQKKKDEEIEAIKNKIITEFDVMMGNELKKYTPGTDAYNVTQSKLKEEKDRLITQLELEKKYGRTGGNGYSGYSYGGRNSEKSNVSNYKNHEYQYYNELKTLIGSIDDTIDGSYKSYENSVANLKKLQNDLNHDLQFNDTVSDGMKKEMFTLINSKIKYYEGKLKHGVDWDYMKPKKTAEDIAKEPLPSMYEIIGGKSNKPKYPRVEYKKSSKKNNGKYSMYAPK